MNNTVNRASLGAKKNKIFKSGFCEKLKLLLIPLGLLIGGFTMQVWGYTATFRCVPGLAFDGWEDNSSYGCKVNLRSKNDNGDDCWHTSAYMQWYGLMYEKDGVLYKIFETTLSDLDNDGAKSLKFISYHNGNHYKDSYKYDGWQSCTQWNGTLYTDSYTGFSYKTWDIPSGTTVVWDAGNQEELWTSAQMYYYKSGWNSDQSSSTTDFTRLGTTQQFYHTYDGTWEGYGGLIIRQSSSWNGQTTNITTDVESSSNFVLFTHSGGGDHGSYTEGKCDWQKVSPAFKATSGATIYFDNTVTEWTQPYLKYGSQWFNRSAEMSEVPGTNGKLWKYTFLNDMYYGEYMVADGYGYVNYNPIDDSHCSHYTTLQAANISSATTLIPTANAQKGATSVLDGYERTVTISSYSHGTVHVTYTNANNAAQDKTTGNFDVQQACVITVTATADEGYRLTGLTVGGAAFTSGNTYPVRDDITIAATFTPNTYSVQFNANYPVGAINNGASMSNQDFAYAVAENINANAFACEGYTFTGWKKDNATSGDDVTAGSDGSTLTTANGATVQLYAQWTDTHKYYYKGASADGWNTASSWTRNAVPGTGDDVILLTDVEVPSGTTTVNSVRIATSGNYTPVGGDEITADGSLTIPAGRMLVVTQDVKNCTISDNAPTTGTATTSGTLTILGATTGNGALIWGTTGTPGEATVEFVTISGGKPGSSEAVNQYIGIPFTSMNSYAYSTASYSAWVFEVSGGAWSEIHGETMSPWKGYNLIAQYGKDDEVPSSTSYYLSGELVSNAGGSITGVSAGSETLYANSWVAPILIKNIESEKFTYTDANIYIFNSASEDGIIAPTGSQHAAMGNYTTYPVNQSGSAVIPSMQSFSTWGSGTLTLVYNDVVNYSGVSHSTIAPNRAPKYDYREAIWATQDTVTLNVSSASGWADELKIYIHEDFSDDFESGWDGRKMEGSWEAPQLYAATGFGQMAVNCVKTIDNSVIGFHAGTAANEYSMTIKYSGEDELYLRDTKTGVETPITKETKYEFTSDAKDSDMRFVIKKAPKIVTGMDEVGTNSNVQKFMHDGTLYIIRNGRIYNAEGSLVK